MALPQSKPPAAFRKHVLALLGETYGDKTLVLCPTAFVTLLNGDHKAAILLAQILYWSDKTKDPDGWFYKSYTDWRTETGLSEAQVRRIVNGDPRVQSPQVTLRDLGVETILRKVKRTGAPTLHYRINQAQFLAVLERLLGQCDPEQCQGSIPDKAQDELSTLPRLNSDQSKASLIPPEITNPETLAEDYNQENPIRPDEDSDLDIFTAYENRFGKIKDPLLGPLRAERIRLGATTVREVLDRCATRGRSWAYVQRAFANEHTPVSIERVPTWSELASADQATQPSSFLEPQEAPAEVFVSERVQTLWRSSNRPGMTVQDAWKAAYHQLELQLRASFYPWGLGVRLVDFEPESQTFFLVVRTAYARDVFEGRLNRMVKRIFGDVYGQPVALRYLLKEDWQAQMAAGEVA